MDLILVFLIVGISVGLAVSVWAIDKFITYRQAKKEREQRELQDYVLRKFGR